MWLAVLTFPVRTSHPQFPLLNNANFFPRHPKVTIMEKPKYPGVASKLKLWKGEWIDRLEREAFAIVPRQLISHLTPEEFRSRQQLYQQAYEDAVERVKRKESNDYLEYGDGI